MCSTPIGAMAHAEMMRARASSLGPPHAVGSRKCAEHNEPSFAPQSRFYTICPDYAETLSGGERRWWNKTRENTRTRRSAAQGTGEKICRYTYDRGYPLAPTINLPTSTSADGDVASLKHADAPDGLHSSHLVLMLAANSCYLFLLHL